MVSSIAFNLCTFKVRDSKETQAHMPLRWIGALLLCCAARQQLLLFGYSLSYKQLSLLLIAHVAQGPHPIPHTWFKEDVVQQYIYSLSAIECYLMHVAQDRC